MKKLILLSSLAALTIAPLTAFAGEDQEVVEVTGEDLSGNAPPSGPGTGGGAGGPPTTVGGIVPGGSVSNPGSSTTASAVTSKSDLKAKKERRKASKKRGAMDWFFGLFEPEVILADNAQALLDHALDVLDNALHFRSDGAKTETDTIKYIDPKTGQVTQTTTTTKCESHTTTIGSGDQEPGPSCLDIKGQQIIDGGKQKLLITITEFETVWVGVGSTDADPEGYYHINGEKFSFIAETEAEAAAFLVSLNSL